MDDDEDLPIETGEHAEKTDKIKAKKTPAKKKKKKVTQKAKKKTK